MIREIIEHSYFIENFMGNKMYGFVFVGYENLCSSELDSKMSKI